MKIASHEHQNTGSYTGRMFVQVTSQQCQSTKGKIGSQTNI